MPGAWCPLSSPSTGIRSGVFLEELGTPRTSPAPSATRDRVNRLSRGRVPAAKALCQARVRGLVVLGGVWLFGGAEETLWPALAL